MSDLFGILKIKCKCLKLGWFLISFKMISAKIPAVLNFGWEFKTVPNVLFKLINVIRLEKICLKFDHLRKSQKLFLKAKIKFSLKQEKLWQSQTKK
jgi:hypothetical protein